MKWLGKTIVVIGLLVAGFYAVNNYIYNEKQGDSRQNQSMTATTPTRTMENSYHITPLSHATMVIQIAGQVVYVDPVGGATAFSGQPTPNSIVITDIHGDHMDADTLKAIAKEDTIIVVPQAVADELPDDLSGTIVVLANGQITTQKNLEIEAIPMYNIPESQTAYHTKGRGNGYIISGGGKRIYIAGDTSVTPEMRALRNIDVAFVPMNLPYTMTVEEAAEGVLAFKPTVVHPYHYRGQDGLSDINKFKELVNKGDASITVELLNFYPSQ